MVSNINSRSGPEPILITHKPFAMSSDLIGYIEFFKEFYHCIAANLEQDPEPDPT